MNIYEPLVQDFMTLQPQTIEGKENVETAKGMMSRFSIRHLPVVNDGIVAGILSERELNIAAGIECIDPKQLLVMDMCSERPYVVHPDTTLREVVDVMAKKHFGSAIVMENTKLVGIFTTVDACRALHNLLNDAVQESNRECTQKFKFFLKPDRKVVGGGKVS